MKKPYKQSLRRRITLSFTLFGAVMSLVIATGVFSALEDIEDELIEKGLQQELQYFINQGDKRLGTTEQISSDIVLYYTDKAHDNILPDVIRALPVGHADFEYENQLFYTLVTPVGEGILYLVRDATHFEKRELTIQISLMVSVVVATLIALWLGTWLSGRVISPVSSLANEVENLTPGNKAPNPIAKQYANDEVGQLASTFDTYLNKMEQFISREQEFTSDASHELRTPLSVIMGAAELLLENPQLPERSTKQVGRIYRAAKQMHNMLEILLLLARETPISGPEHQEQCDVQEVINELVEQHRFLSEDKALRLYSEVIEPFSVKTSKTILNIVLSNLLRNAINYTEQGEIKIKVINHCIEVHDTGEGIPPEALEQIFERHYRGPNSKGSGIGLSLVKRICDRQGWQIVIHSKLEAGTTVVIKF